MKACGLALAIMMLLAPVWRWDRQKPPVGFAVWWRRHGAAVARCSSSANIFTWPVAAATAPPSRPGARDGSLVDNSEIVKKLGLSETQVTRIEQTFMQSLLRIVDLRADLEKQELQLRPLLDVDRPDEARVAAQLDLITATRGKLEKEHVLMMLAIRGALSIEQWKSLQQERGRPGAPLPPCESGPQPPHQFSPGFGR